MIYTVKSRRGGAKLVDNGNYIYRLDRKYREKTYWKCEVKQCKARVHTTHKDDTLSICAAFGDHCHSSNPIKPTICKAKSCRGANCSLYQVDIVSHISINGVCSGRVRRKFRAANFPMANFLAAKILRTQKINEN